MNKKEEQKISKFISLILRHKPEVIGVTLDNNGWCNTEELLNGCRITIDELINIVENDSKTRYAFNEDKSKIRANQGHSINVDLNLKSIKPPDVLYHGTSTKYINKILLEGIKKITRKHVHLSDNLETAKSVGERHGNPVILSIDSKSMYNDGYKFYLSENKVWLCDYISTKYIKIINK